MKNSIFLAIALVSLSALPLFARQWSSRNGGFSAEAELVDVKDGNVILKRPDGSQLSVPLNKLSLGDIRYINEELKAAETGITGGKKEVPPPEKPQSNPAPKAVANVNAAKLQYKWKPGQTYVYRVKIVGEQGDYGEYIKGDVTYKVQSVADDEVELDVTKTLTSGQTTEHMTVLVVPSVVPHRFIRVFAMFNGSKDSTITVDPSGQTIHVKDAMQLPYLLGDLSQLMIEPLAMPKDGVWTIDNTGATVVETSYPYRRYTRIHSYEGVPANEKSVYTIQGQTKNLVTIAKHYELTTQATVNEKPQFEAKGDGKLIFDTDRGIPSSLTFNVQVTAREATRTEEIPFRITYRLLTDEESAKIAKDAESAKKKREESAKEKARPMTDAEVQSVLTELESEDAARVREATKLLSDRKPSRPNPQIAKALEAAMLNSENNGEIRMNAAKAMKAWATNDNIPGLLTALGDEWPPVRAAAIEALIKFKPKNGIDAIGSQLADHFTRVAAAKALKAYGPAAEQAVLPHVDSRDAWTAAEACKILQAIGTKKSIPTLEKAAKSSDWMVSKAAKSALDGIELREHIKPGG